MPNGLVSVIIAVHNGVPHLDWQLQALAAQDYKGEFEVIVSDNGSSDGTRGYLEALTPSFPFRWVDSSGIRGAAHARNVGIDAARGDLLAVLDHDDVADPHWLSAITHAAEKFDAVGGSIELTTLNSTEVATWRRMPPPEKRFETFYLPYAQGNNFALWRTVVNKIGYYDEELIGGGEDVDYSWRIQEAGLTLGHVPDAVVAYRLRPTMHASFRQGTNYGRTSCQVVRKHEHMGCPNPSCLTQIPAILATIFFLAILRNPWLPNLLSPQPRGLWAHNIGLQWGALSTRVRFLLQPKDAVGSEYSTSRQIRLSPTRNRSS